MAVPVPSLGWLAAYASACFAASFQARSEDKDLASVVWESSLAALQAVAAEPPKPRSPKRPEPNNEDRNGHGFPVSKKFLDRKIAARLPRRCPRQVERRIIADYSNFTRYCLHSDRSASDASRAGERKLGAHPAPWPDLVNFFGDDIVAYQRNQEAIHPGLWEAFNLWERLRARSRR